MPNPRTLGVWELAWPSMTLFALQSLVGLVDFVFVGSLGRNAVAGVGVASQIFFFLFAVLAMVTTGGLAVVARDWGAGDRGEADRTLRISVGLGVLLATVALFAIPASEAIVSLFGVRDEVVAVGGSYLRILLPFAPAFAFGMVLATCLRGVGDVRTPLAIGIVTNAVNVVGNWALIFGHLGAPALGTDGSALASGLAYSTGAAIYALLWLRNGLAVPRGPWLEGLSWGRSWRILRIGLPTSAEQIVWQIGLFLFLRIVAGYGTEALAAYLIGVRILSFSFVPGVGFSMAAATLVGQHLGAGRPEAAAQAGWRASRACMAVMACAGLSIVLGARPLAEMFGAAGTRTVDLTVWFIYILGAAQPLMALEFALGGALRGAGDTRFPLLSILTGLFAVRLAGALLVSRWLDPGGSVVPVWSCLLADYAVKAALLSARFARGRWRDVRV